MRPLELGSAIGPAQKGKRNLDAEVQRPIAPMISRAPYAAATVETAMAVIELKPLSVNSAEWDAFAERCGGSIRATYGYTVAWAAKNVLQYRLRLFEFYLGGRQGPKIGQCAIGESRRGGSFIFLDRLQLLPTHEPSWRMAMQTVLSVTGSGQYKYGWVLNLEPAREGHLSEISGVTVVETNPLVVQAVDFSQWSNWDAYYSAISENTRRNAKSATKNFPDLKVTIKAGAAALRHVPSLVRLRDHLSERKGLDNRTAIAAAIGYFGSIMSCRNQMVTAVVTGGGSELSCYYGAEFGQNTYYLEGASASNNRGAAWQLLIEMLRRAYGRTPTGKFIMGYIDYSTHDDEKSSGLLRSRQACRVTDYATSMVWFRYRA